MDFGYKVTLVLPLNNIMSYLILNLLQNPLPLLLCNISLRHSKESKNVKGHVINDEACFFKNFKVHMSKIPMALKLKLVRRLCINYT